MNVKVNNEEGIKASLCSLCLGPTPTVSAGSLHFSFGLGLGFGLGSLGTAFLMLHIGLSRSVSDLGFKTRI